MSHDYQRIEVITGTARRRLWSAEEKLRMVEETLRPGGGSISTAVTAKWCRAEPAVSLAPADGGGRDSRDVAAEGRYPVKAVAATLGVSRSNLIEGANGSGKPRRHYHKAQDTAVLPLVRSRVDARPTYDCRRITARVNRGPPDGSYLRKPTQDVIIIPTLAEGESRRGLVSVMRTRDKKESGAKSDRHTQKSNGFVRYPFTHEPPAMACSPLRSDATR